MPELSKSRIKPSKISKNRQIYQKIGENVEKPAKNRQKKYRKTVKNDKKPLNIIKNR